MDRNKSLHVTLWIFQVVLAIFFLMVGITKTFTPINELPEQMSWGKEMPGLMRFVGICELLGAIGLILPSLLRIYPILTPLAALGFATIMILAMGFHLMRNEPQVIPLNLLLLAASLFVAWGRWKKVPIQPKNS